MSTKKSRSEKIQRLYDAQADALENIMASMDLDEMRGILDACYAIAYEVANEYEEAAPAGKGPNQEKSDINDEVDDDLVEREALRTIMINVLTRTSGTDLILRLRALDIETECPLSVLDADLDWQALKATARDTLINNAAESLLETARAEAIDALNGLEL